MHLHWCSSKTPPGASCLPHPADALYKCEGRLSAATTRAGAGAVGGGSMGKARRWAKVLPDPSCCPALPLLLLALIGTVAFAFSRPPAALLQCGPATPLTLLLVPRPEAQSRTGAAARGSEEVARRQRRASAQRQSTSSRAGEAAARASTSTGVRDHVGRMSSSDLRFGPSLGHSFVEKRDKPQTAGLPSTPSTPVPFASLICQDKTGTEPALKGLLASLD